MPWLSHTLGIVGVTLLMISVFPTLFGHLPFPNLFALVPLIFLVRQAPVPALVWAVVGGLIMDVIVPGTSWYSLVFVSTVLLLWLLNERLQHASSPFMIIALTGAVVIVPLFEWLRVGADFTWLFLGTIIAQTSGFLLLLGLSRLWTERRGSGTGLHRGHYAAS